MPLPLRDFENRLNALNEALDSLRSVIQHPTHTISPADISNGYLEELRMMDFSQDRYGQAHGTAETHPTTHRFHASRVATPGDDHLHEAMARQRQQSYNLQEQPWTVPAGDPSTEKRELDLMVRKIKDTINVRLTLIEMIKTEVELYEDKKKRVKEAYFDYVKAKRGGEVEGTKKVAYEVLYNCLVDAGNTLFTLECFCKDYEEAHNKSASSAYKLMSGPHWCEYGVVEGFVAPQADCVIVLEDLKIAGYNNDTRRLLDYGRRIVMQIQAFLREHQDTLNLAAQKALVYGETDDDGRDAEAEAGQTDRATASPDPVLRPPWSFPSAFDEGWNSVSESDWR